MGRCIEVRIDSNRIEQHGSDRSDTGAPDWSRRDDSSVEANRNALSDTVLSGLSATPAEMLLMKS